MRKQLLPKLPKHDIPSKVKVSRHRFLAGPFVKHFSPMKRTEAGMQIDRNGQLEKHDFSIRRNLLLPSNVTASRPAHSKHDVSRISTDRGIVIDFNSAQQRKQESPIRFSLDFASNAIVLRNGCRWVLAGSRHWHPKQNLSRISTEQGMQIVRKLLM
jgi:ribosomal protein S8